MEKIIRAPAVALETRLLRRTPAQRKQTSIAAAEIAVPSAAMPARHAVNIGQPAMAKEPAPEVPEPNAHHLIEQELANARLQIEQEVAQARVQLEQEAAALRAAAERDGYAKGMEKGELAARQAVAEQIERLESIAAGLVEARHSALSDAEEAIVEVVHTAICRIIGEVATSRSAVSGMVNQVLEAYKEHNRLVVRLHPQDMDLLQQTRETAGAHEATWRPDPSIKLGGCIVESGTGFLDARIETQLARLGEALLSARRKRQGEAS